MRCPMSGQVLKMKDLINVKFTPINDRDNKTSLIAKSVSVNIIGVGLPLVFVFFLVLFVSTDVIPCG